MSKFTARIIGSNAKQSFTVRKEAIDFLQAQGFSLRGLHSHVCSDQWFNRKTGQQATLEEVIK